MATHKTYTVIKDGVEMKELKSLAAAKKLADTEGAQVVCEGDTVYVSAQTTTITDELVEETVVEDVPAAKKYALTAKMNIRKAPALDAAKLGVAQPGTVVDVTDIVDDWLHLTDGTFILYGGGKFSKKN